MSECPDLEALERWCAHGEDAALAAHVDRCADCRALADELRANLAATARWGQLPPADDEASPPTIPGLRLQDCIASGGQGTVWRGVQLATGRAVAVKTIRRAADAAARARFAREARLGASLRHANLVSVLDAGATGDGVLYLVMEYVDGETLEAARQRAAPSLDDALACFLAITDGVRFAHQHGVLHRDLKPGNLLRTADGSVRILDFGLAKALAAVQPDPHATLDGTFVGTLACAAPEQLRADGTAGDVRTDLFQLGVVFYRYLTGGWPHPPEADPRAMLARRLHDAPARPSRACPDLPNDLDTVVLRLLAPEPERRYATAHELWTDLERCRSGLPILARADEIQVRIARLLRRYRTAAIAAAVVVIGLGAATWLVLGYAERAEADRRTIAREYERAEEALGILQRAMDAFEAGPAGPKTPMVDFLDRVVTELEQRPSADPRARADLLLRAADLYSRIADPARAAPFVARARAVLHAAGDVDRTIDLDLRGRELRLLASAAQPGPELPGALRAHRDAVAKHHGEGAAATLQLDVLLTIAGSGSDAAQSLQRLRAIAPRIAALPAGPERERVQGQHDFVAVMIAASAGAHAEALQRGRELLQQPVGESYADRVRRFAILQVVAPAALQTGELELADTLTAELVARAEDVALPDDPRRAEAAFVRGLCLLRLNRTEPANQHLRDYVAAVDRGMAPDPHKLAVACVQLGCQARLDADQPAAVEWLTRARGGIPDPARADELTTVELMLADSLLQLQRRDEALPLLHAARARVVARHGEGHATVREIDAMLARAR
ncbi:MAG: serine/threonine protein kinase [Planctomycetes bacterium]|jgi:hypothetical protein|nr:serine/threonine protein kinase [Planctomycetota bacterium]